MAANATRRCAELESRLAELERRATDAEARVQHLDRELTKCEKRVNMPAIVVVPKVLRQKVIGLVRRFHPDRTASTTPTDITKALNVLVEEIDMCNLLGLTLFRRNPGRGLRAKDEHVHNQILHGTPGKESDAGSGKTGYS